MVSPTLSDNPPPPRMPRPPTSALLALAVAATLEPPAVHAQHVPGSALYNASAARQAAALSAQLRHAPVLEDVFYPAKYRLPTDFYVASAHGGAYTQNVIFDPCRQYGPGCCDDTFGTPEFASPDAALPEDEDAPRARSLRADGSELPQESSRRPDDELHWQPACAGLGVPHASCVASQLAAAPFRLMPRCWDFNASVVADRHCRSPADGSPVELCVEVGVSQNALIVECGGGHAGDPHCGTYLEVHRPGDAQVLADARLPGMFTSGYRCVR